MTLEFLVQPEVREVLFQLVWGDRFEKDLKSNMTSDERFDSIRDRLHKEELVYLLRGENNSPYLSLTDKGVAIINRLYEIERIIEGEDSDTE
ncbi:MAG: hypothetical protein E3J86_01815 [Candidatus Thorarchaeota archaeon]|jgi:hypothetical protein|nr:MAG: hypothetical protein E3J86_01815 [Candidatus Thorarchaeota archaeon]